MAGTASTGSVRAVNVERDASTSWRPPHSIVTRRIARRNSADSAQSRSRSSLTASVCHRRENWKTNGRGASSVPRIHVARPSDSATFLSSSTRGSPLISEVPAESASIPTTNRSKPSTRRRVASV